VRLCRPRPTTVRFSFHSGRGAALPQTGGLGQQRLQYLLHHGLARRADRVLQLSLTRAVIFSAAATATGRVWLSSHPDTSSLGKLLALSLVCTLAVAVLFQPVLMGPPPEIGE